VPVHGCVPYGICRCRHSPMRCCSQGYTKVAATPDAALKPRAMLSVASVMPRHLRSCTPGVHGPALIMMQRQ